MLIKCQQNYGQKLSLNHLISADNSIIFYGDTARDIKWALTRHYLDSKFAFQPEGYVGALYGEYQKAFYGSSHQHDSMKLLHQGQKLGQGTISIPGLGKVVKRYLKTECFVALVYSKRTPIQSLQVMHGQKNSICLIDLNLRNSAPGERKSIEVVGILAALNVRVR